jgi:hypothetical protein
MLRAVYDEIGSMPEEIMFLHAQLLYPEYVKDQATAMKYKNVCDKLTQAIWSLEELARELEQNDQPVVATLVREELPDGTVVAPPVEG